MSPFTINLSSSGPSPITFAILANPSLLMKSEGTIYVDYFPQAWAVCDFGSASDPIELEFSAKLSLVARETCRGNRIRAATHLDLNGITNQMYALEVSGAACAFDPKALKAASCLVSVVNHTEVDQSIVSYASDSISYSTEIDLTRRDSRIQIR